MDNWDIGYGFISSIWSVWLILSIWLIWVYNIILRMEEIYFVNGHYRFALEVSLRLEFFLELCESRALRTPLIILVNKYPISYINVENVYLVSLVSMVCLAPVKQATRLTG